MNEPVAESNDIIDPHRHTILIIDDVPANLAVVADDLAQHGFQIKIASTGEAGLRIAIRAPPDLVLLDVQLPDVDGFEICRRLKADKRTREVPIIFMTVMTHTEHKVKGFEVGGVDYITKPVQHEEVLARVTAHLRLRDLTRKLEEAKGGLERRVAERTSELAQANISLKKEIIEHKLTEAALAKSEQEYRSLAENSPDNIIRYDRQCRVIYCNPMMAQSLGVDTEAVLGKTPMELAGGTTLEISAEFDRQVRRALESGEPSEIEITLPHPDGELRDHLIRLVAERDGQGSIVGVLAIGRDITRRKMDEKALQKLNRELRALSDCNQTLVRAVDEQELLDDICRIICEGAGYPLAWVGYPEDDADKTLRPVAWAGVKEGYLEQAQLSWADTDRGRGPGGIAIRSGEIASIDDFAKDPAAIPWRDAALQAGFLSAIALPLKDDSGQVFGILGIYSAEANAFPKEERRLLSELAGDLAFGIVTLRRRDEHDRAEEQIRIAATAFEAQEGIVITDARQKILRVNLAFTEITGYSAEEAVGSTPRLLKSDRQDAAYFQNMWECIQHEGAWQGEIWNRRKNGELYPGWLNITAVRNRSGEVSHYVGTMTDITERKAAEAKIEHLAYHDTLTLLPNRRLLLDRLEQALAAGARKPHWGALLFIDLDNFKLLNDTRGHIAGDQLLVEVGQRLIHCVRKEDTIARVGGDEFMIMLNDLGRKSQEAANQSTLVGKKILRELNQPYTIAGYIHHNTASLGITLFCGRMNTVDELMKQADIAMYQAKTDGRNTLRFFDPEMQAALAERASLEAALRRGIEEHQFFLHYQPQVDSVRGILGAELLLRWNHPERGLVSPDEFIPLAEESGLILPIGQWVLETACKQLKAWATHPQTRELDLAANVSQYQFRQADFVDQVRRALEKYETPPMHLKIELTESLLIDEIEDSIKKMHALEALGVRFSLDDFGTGYSSLSYLTQLPLAQLKIDISFIRNLPRNHNDAIVAQTIITMAQSLELTVIAEGVEAEPQRHFLEQHGCTTYQGNLFSKPVALSEFEEMLGVEHSV